MRTTAERPFSRDGIIPENRQLTSAHDCFKTGETADGGALPRDFALNAALKWGEKRLLGPTLGRQRGDPNVPKSETVIWRWRRCGGDWLSRLAPHRQPVGLVIPAPQVQQQDLALDYDRPEVQVASPLAEHQALILVSVLSRI